MKVIVGLGNPGIKYSKTRHSIGFEVIDYIHIQKEGTPWEKKSKFQSLFSEIMWFGQKIYLVKPLTYMNRSGEAVSAVCNFYQMNESDLLVIHDDYDLPLGEVRLRTNSEGKSTHNGIRSIVQHLHNPDFYRIRLGIHSYDNSLLPKEQFVLEKFSKLENLVVQNMLKKTVDIISKILTDIAV